MPSTQTITVRGAAVTLVSFPDSPAARMVEFGFASAVAAVSFPFSGDTQTQEWLGADRLSCTVTLPPLTAAQRGAWKAFLMQMDGMANAVLMGDPDCASANGELGDGSVPVVDGSDATKNLPGSKLLYTKAWDAGVARALVAGDALQVGYRLHYVVDTVATDGNGNAVIPVRPSLREQPADEATIVLAQPKGLFRMADNKRSWSRELLSGTRISFPLTEFK